MNACSTRSATAELDSPPRNYQGHRFSLLKDINTDTVSNLKLTYTVALSGLQPGGRYAHGQLEATALVEDGFMYVPDGWGVSNSCTSMRP